MEENKTFITDEENENAFLLNVQAMLREKKFALLRETLDAYPAADIGALYGELDEHDELLLFRVLPKEKAAEVFVEMDSDTQERLIRCFSDRELKDILDELYMDDTVDIIEEMPASVVARILRNSSAASRKDINMLLRYPKNSAGSMMTTEFVRLDSQMTVKDAFSAIRQDAINKETVYTCYITDTNRHLRGVITVKTLLLSPLDALVGDIMEENVVYARTLTDKEEVALMFDKYDFLALPVADTEGRLVGIITIDDAMDVMAEEVEEDFTKMAAITPSETPYLRTNVFSIFLSRFPWLLLLMISATFTGMIISGFEAALSSCVVLTAFIPVIMGTGGNSGSQSSVTVIRGLSLGEIGFRDVWRVIFKELRISLLCAIALGAVSFGKILLIDRLLLGNEAITLEISFAVSITLAITVVIAKLIGALLPILAKRIKLDPAVMASPFITTIVDALSLLVYFAVASSLLPI